MARCAYLERLDYKAIRKYRKALLDTVIVQRSIWLLIDTVALLRIMGLWG